MLFAAAYGRVGPSHSDAAVVSLCILLLEDRHVDGSESGLQHRYTGFRVCSTGMQVREGSTGGGEPCGLTALLVTNYFEHTLAWGAGWGAAVICSSACLPQTCSFLS